MCEHNRAERKQETALLARNILHTYPRHPPTLTTKTEKLLRQHQSISGLASKA